MRVRTRNAHTTQQRQILHTINLQWFPCVWCSLGFVFGMQEPIWTIRSQLYTFMNVSIIIKVFFFLFIFFSLFQKKNGVRKRRILRKFIGKHWLSHSTISIFIATKCHTYILCVLRIEIEMERRPVLSRGLNFHLSLCLVGMEERSIFIFNQM